MKLAILQCDEIRAEFHEQYGLYHQMFIHLFNKVHNSIEYLIYDVEHGIFPPNITVADVYLITGSRHGVMMVIRG